MARSKQRRAHIIGNIGFWCKTVACNPQEYSVWPITYKPMNQSLSHAAHLPPASTRLSSGARLALTATIFLALATRTMSSVLLIDLLRTCAQATAGMDYVLAQLEATYAPGAQPLMFPMTQTIPFKGLVQLLLPYQFGGTGAHGVCPGCIRPTRH